MSNPLWFIEMNFEKVKAGTRVLERAIVRSAGALGDKVGLDTTFRREIVRQVIRRLVLAAIEVGLVSLARSFLRRRPPARVYSFATPHSVP
jgi:hypothetical protein